MRVDLSVLEKDDGSMQMEWLMAFGAGLGCLALMVAMAPRPARVRATARK
ncbi:hypothetical protein [Falsirhodobacter halotolerans]|nr:hypothetical protein [Falsirhodobacter halotolerans]MCJ8140243.1 hypothetical protein [Falsirhodobacter halotolerans]